MNGPRLAAQVVEASREGSSQDCLTASHALARRAGQARSGAGPDHLPPGVFTHPAGEHLVVVPAEHRGQERPLRDPEPGTPVGGGRGQVVVRDHPADLDQDRLRYGWDGCQVRALLPMRVSSTALVTWR